MVASGEQDPISPGTGHQAPPFAIPSEQRRHVRFQIDDAPTSFSIKGVSTSLGLGKVERGRAAINLSEGGAMLLVRDPLPLGTAVVVRIEMDGVADFVEAAGTVRWCERQGTNSKDYHAGIEFIALGEADVRRIAKICDLGSSRPKKDSL